jgi:hypothetical protein
MRLGVRVHCIRRGTAYNSASYKRRLDEVGFVWEKQISHRDFEIIYQALQRYKAINGHLKIPFAYTVPTGTMAEDEGWPQPTWGMRLGVRVFQIRRKGAYVEHLSRLQKLGVFDPV